MQVKKEQNTWPRISRNIVLSTVALHPRHIRGMRTEKDIVRTRQITRYAFPSERPRQAGSTFTE